MANIKESLAKIESVVLSRPALPVRLRQVTNISSPLLGRGATWFAQTSLEAIISQISLRLLIAWILLRVSRDQFRLLAQLGKPGCLALARGASETNFQKGIGKRQAQ